MQYFSCPAKSTGFFEQSGHTENSPQCSHSLQPDPPLQVFWHPLQRFTLSRSSRLLALCSCLASLSFLRCSFSTAWDLLVSLLSPCASLLFAAASSRI